MERDDRLLAQEGVDSGVTSGAVSVDTGEADSKAAMASVDQAVAEAKEVSLSRSLALSLSLYSRSLALSLSRSALALALALALEARCKTCVARTRVKKIKTTQTHDRQ